MHSTRDDQIAKAYRYCRKIAQQHYENFPVVFFMTSAKKKNYLAAIYAFARMADDIADEENIPAPERITKLFELEKELRLCYEGKATSPVFLALQDTIFHCQLPIELFLSLLVAFKTDCVIHRYQTFDELLGYCNHSANPIGRLVLLVSGIQNEKLFYFSDQICTALQLTNFWQDIVVDLDKNRLYIPQQDLQKFNLMESDIQNKIYNESFQDLMTHLIKKTQSFFDSGKPILFLPDRILRFYLKLVWLGGTEILREIKHNNYDIYNKRPHISAATKLRLLIKAIFI